MGVFNSYDLGYSSQSHYTGTTSNNFSGYTYQYTTRSGVTYYLQDGHNFEVIRKCDNENIQFSVDGRGIVTCYPASITTCGTTLITNPLSYIDSMYPTLVKSRDRKLTLIK